MKKLFNWLWHKAINFFKWVWRECRNWQTVLLLVFVCIVVGAPVWISGLLGLLFNWAWAWVVFWGLLAFWWLPGMPYFAVCVSITLVIKRIFGKRQQKQLRMQNEAEKAAAEESVAGEQNDFYTGNDSIADCDDLIKDENTENNE